MATTKTKDNSSLGKERRISGPTSSSSSVSIPNTPPTPTKRTPKSSPKSSPFTDHKLHLPSSSSSPSERHLPNYLKSTASSKQLKKPGPVTDNRPTLNRRRSFDKPPSTAPRLFRSPEPKDRAPHVPVRSSSFGAKSAGYAKPGSWERSVPKASRVGKSLLTVQSLKGGSNAKKGLKKEPNNAASAVVEMTPKTKNAVGDVDECCLVPGDDEEEIKKIECELDSTLPDPMLETDKEINISSKDEVEKHHQTLLDRKISISTVVSDTAAEAPPTTETGTENSEAEAKISTPEKENQEPNEGAGEIDGGEEKSDAEEKEVVLVVVSEESGENAEKIGVEEKSEIDEDHKEAEDGQSSMEEDNANLKAETAETAAKQRRKESPGVYNDVIEETASKLLETRKNKVKALAGAFQTVIDYETSSSK